MLRCPLARVATPDALDALGGVAAGPPHEPIAIRLIRDIRPRCALAAAAHVAMMIDVECRRDQKLSVDLKTQPNKLKVDLDVPCRVCPKKTLRPGVELQRVA